MRDLIGRELQNLDSQNKEVFEFLKETIMLLSISNLEAKGYLLLEEIASFDVLVA